KPKERSASSQPVWRRESPGAGTTSDGRWAWHTKRGIGIAGLVAATAVLVIVILWWKPAKPVRLVLLGADYVLDAHRNPTLAIPANAYGWEGLKALASLQSEGVSVVADPPEEYRLNNDWYKRAEEAKEETLVVFMTLHGGVDSHGP